MRVMLVNWKRGLVAVALGLLLGLSGCDSTTDSGPEFVDESQLDFVPRSLTAPNLETMDTSFWAVKGQERDLVIRYVGEGGGETGEKFLELVIEDQTLLSRPDGTPFADGDSIEISVSVDPDLFIVQFDPSGLQFNPEEPAKLSIEYDEAEDDYLEREGEFQVWKQESAGDQWELLGSSRTEELDEIEVLLLGFTRYGLAVGR